jgi:transcriptional regulator
VLEQRIFAMTDVAELRAVVDAGRWATMITAPPDRDLVVSHLPVMVDPSSDGLVLLGHLARADATLHELGRHDTVVVVQGPHGYVSPTFYTGGPYVPTWNFVVVHLHGRPEPLGGEETYALLERTVAHFEPSSWRLDRVADYAHRIVGGVAAFRLAPDRVVGKAKLSQDKPAADVHGVVAALDGVNPQLAAAMRRVSRSKE